MIIHGKIKKVKRKLAWLQVYVKEFGIGFPTYIKMRLKEKDVDKIIRNPKTNKIEVNRLKGFKVKMYIYK